MDGPAWQRRSRKHMGSFSASISLFTQPQQVPVFAPEWHPWHLKWTPHQQSTDKSKYIWKISNSDILPLTESRYKCLIRRNISIITARSDALHKIFTASLLQLFQKSVSHCTHTSWIMSAYFRYLILQSGNNKHNSHDRKVTVKWAMPVAPVHVHQVRIVE